MSTKTPRQVFVLSTAAQGDDLVRRLAAYLRDRSVRVALSWGSRGFSNWWVWDSEPLACSTHCVLVISDGTRVTRTLDLQRIHDLIAARPVYVVSMDGDPIARKLDFPEALAILAFDGNPARLISKLAASMGVRRSLDRGGVLPRSARPSDPIKFRAWFIRRLRFLQQANARYTYRFAIQLVEQTSLTPGEDVPAYQSRLRNELLQLRAQLWEDDTDPDGGGVGAVRDALILLGEPGASRSVEVRSREQRKRPPADGTVAHKLKAPK